MVLVLTSRPSPVNFNSPALTLTVLPAVTVSAWDSVMVFVPLPVPSESMFTVTAPPTLVSTASNVVFVAAMRLIGARTEPAFPAMKAPAVVVAIVNVLAAGTAVMTKVPLTPVTP